MQSRCEIPIVLLQTSLYCQLCDMSKQIPIIGFEIQHNSLDLLWLFVEIGKAPV